MPAPDAPLPIAQKVAEAVRAYYRQAQTITPTTKEQYAWYNQQSERDRQELSEVHVAQWRLLPSFQRYLLEARGYSLHAHLRAHLSPREWAHWMDEGTAAPG